MESFDYRRIAEHDDDGIPYLVEAAFGWLGDDAPNWRRLVTGLNCSAGILNPFRQLGGYGESSRLAACESSGSGLTSRSSSSCTPPARASSIWTGRSPRW